VERSVFRQNETSLRGNEFPELPGLELPRRISCHHLYFNAGCFVKASFHGHQPHRLRSAVSRGYWRSVCSSQLETVEKSVILALHGAKAVGEWGKVGILAIGLLGGVAEYISAQRGCFFVG
jgi:hypothetical protein